MTNERQHVKVFELGDLTEDVVLQIVAEIEEVLAMNEALARCERNGRTDA